MDWEGGVPCGSGGRVAIIGWAWGLLRAIPFGVVRRFFPIREGALGACFVKMADQFRRAGPVEEPAEILLIFRIRFRIHRDRGIRNHLFQHPDGAVGAQCQGNGITGPGVEFRAPPCFVDQLEHGPEGVVLDGMDHHTLQPQACHKEDLGHQIMAEGPWGALPVDPSEDVLGLGLINPDGHLAAARRVSEKDNRAAAGCIKGNAGDLHFHHVFLLLGLSAVPQPWPLFDYDELAAPYNKGMFTGLVQAIGRLEPCSQGVWVRGALGGLGPMALGDSIAVDGVCLTVAELDGSGEGFRADASEETLSRTTLGMRALARAQVNVEPALRLSDRLGGHMVSGHVDGLGTVLGIETFPASWRLSVAWQDPSYGRYICEKASITVDGISLTVAGSEEGGGRFWLAVIPYTWQNTTLKQRRVGDAVNLEADLVARYLERLLTDQTPRDGVQKHIEQVLSGQWLTDQGW